MGVVSCAIATGEFNSMPIPGLDTEFDVPYNIVTDDINDNGATIYATGCLPARFTSFPDNIFATVRRVGLRREKNAPLIWRATVHYSSAPLTEKEEQQSLSPLDRAAEIDWETVPYQVPVLTGEKTLVGGTKIIVPIVNSAGDTPDPVPEKTMYYWVANVTKNVTSVPSWVMSKYEGSINIAPFTIDGLSVLAECARLINLRVSKKLKENDVRYRTLQFSLEFRGRREQRTNSSGVVDSSDTPPPPFNLELADIGLHGISGSGSRTKFMTDDSPPRPVSQPVLMDGAGGKLANPTAYNMVLDNWRILEKKDFSVLPLV